MNYSVEKSKQLTVDNSSNTNVVDSSTNPSQFSQENYQENIENDVEGNNVEIIDVIIESSTPTMKRGKVPVNPIDKTKITYKHTDEILKQENQAHNNSQHESTFPTRELIIIRGDIEYFKLLCSEFLNKSEIPGCGWLWIIILIGMFYHIGGWIYCYDDDYHDDAFHISFLYGLFQFAIAFFIQVKNEECFFCIYIFCIILSAMFCILSGVFIFATDTYDEIVIMVVIILSIVSLVAVIMYGIVRSKNTPVSSLLSILMKKKYGWLMIIQFVISIVIMFHSYYLFWDDWSHQLPGLFMLVDSFVYFFVTYCETYDDDSLVFKNGVNIGLVWGIVSFLLSFNILSLGNTTVFLVFYTWFISLVSKLVLKNVKDYPICFETFISSNSLLLLFE